MAGITKLYDSLRTEYTKAESELKNVDQNLKKLVGTDSFDNSSRKMDNRKYGRNHYEDDKKYGRSNDMSRKRRLSDSNSRIFSRLGKRLDEGDYKKPSLQSKIVSTKPDVDVKVKEENIVQEPDKKSDKKNDVRNRRMFGMIMGTLQKFQSEETQRKPITNKREEIEKKLDKAVAEEKEEVQKKRLSLIQTKKDKQTQLKDIEVKMDRIEIHQQWEKSYQNLGNFIQTKTKPHIFYMPVKLIPETEKRMKETRDKYLLIQAEKRAKMQKEIDDLNKEQEKLKASSVHSERLDENNENGLKNGRSRSDDKDVKRQKVSNTSTEEGEYNSIEKELSRDSEHSPDTINKERIEDDSQTNLSENNLSEKESNKMTDSNDNLNDLNKLDNLNNNSNALNETKLNEEHKDGDHRTPDEDSNLNSSINKSQTEKILKEDHKEDNKEFEPIYDE